MSETNTSNEHKETDRPASENAFSGHLKMYPKLYQQSCILAATEPKPGDSRGDLLKRIIITLDLVTKTIFGQDQANKAQLVLYGGGALELLVDLVRRSKVLDPTRSTSLLDDQERALLLTAVKGIKICVLRNAPGRARVRISGALDTLLNSVNLCFQQQKNDALLMEEILTTCAAVCLGDDLNALQASFILRKPLRKIEELYPVETNSSMHQKVLYLNTLFDAVEKEQFNLLQFIKKKSSTPQSFFDELLQAEKDVRIGCGHVQDLKHSSALKHFHHALKILEEYQSKTELLNDLILSIRRERISSEFEMGNFETVLADATILLEGKGDNTDRVDNNSSSIAKDEKSLNGRIKIMKLFAKALLKLDKVQEANEVLGKLALLSPHDNDITMLLKSLRL